MQKPFHRFIIFGVLGLLIILARPARADDGGSNAVHTAAEDAGRLYQNDMGITVNIFDNGGQPSFTITRADGLVLRTSFTGEQFFQDRSNGNLEISYTISEETGGVDITYAMTNTSASAQPLPNFLVDGINYAAQNDDDALYILNTATHPYLHQRFLGDADFQSQGYFSVNGDADMPYPRIYAPVIVAHDDDFVAGSALHFNYTVDAIRPIMRVQRDGGRWRHLYAHDSRSKQLWPGESQTITLSLRFAHPRYWLLTLASYKAYFDAQFDAQRDITPRDTRPISGINLSYGTVAYESYQNCLADGVCQEGQPIPEQTVVDRNLRGYNYYIRLDRDGLDGIDPGDPQFVTTYVQRLLDGGYQRNMLWVMGGQFRDCPPGQVSGGNCLTNIPHQFMSDLVSNVENTLDALDQFEQNGIDLGFWWGRAGQVPSPWQWNPDEMLPLDVNDPNHVNPTNNELDLAAARGAKAIGLDAYGNLSPGDQLSWLAHLKDRAPAVDFWTEGSTVDYLHTKATTFLQPEDEWASGHLNDEEIAQPAPLPQYLNPGAEVIAYIRSGSDAEATSAYARRLVTWGYTPLIVARSNIYDIPLVDVTDMDFTLAACFDGIDNDGDGDVDFPYDEGCAYAGAASEIGPEVTASPLTDQTLRLSWDHVDGYLRYEVRRDVSPYFTPMGAAMTSISEAPWQYDDPNALGDPAENHYYLVEGVTAEGRAFSNRVGEFDFSLTPGTASSNY